MTTPWHYHGYRIDVHEHDALYHGKVHCPDSAVIETAESVAECIVITDAIHAITAHMTQTQKSPVIASPELVDTGHGTSSFQERVVPVQYSMDI